VPAQSAPGLEIRVTGYEEMQKIMGKYGGGPTSNTPAHKSTASAAPFRA